MNLIVVGAGWAGERHVRAAKALQRSGAEGRVVALVDTDSQHLAAKSAEWGIPAAYTDLGEALAAHPEAEGIVLATPHNHHRPGTEQAAAAGRHILVEKPIALSLADADAMIAACDDAGVTLMVAESACYRRANLAVREALDAGMIGQVLNGRIEAIYRGRHTYSYPGRRAWLADPDAGGSGIWMLNGIHAMAVARMLLGQPTRIYAREVHSDQFESPLEATVLALVSFAGGAEVAIIVSAELHGYKRFGGIVLFGADGTLACGRTEPAELTVHTDAGPQTVACADPDDPDDTDPAGPFARQLQEFAAAVAERREPFTSGRSERNTLAAIMAGYESVRTGEVVELSGA